jgi:hypothetical protein
MKRSYMPKPKVKKVKFTPEEMAYELPAELDLTKLRYVGSGVDALDRQIARRRNLRTVELAPDVARAFGSDAEINEAMRLVQRMREIGKPAKPKQTA